jgi:hypothetical protein
VGDEIFSYVGTWAVEEPEVYPGLKGDMGLVLSEWDIAHSTHPRLRAFTNRGAALNRRT